MLFLEVADSLKAENVYILDDRFNHNQQITHDVVVVVVLDRLD